MPVKTVFLVTALMLSVTLSAMAGQTRQYWIAAEVVNWNYAPSGKNLIMPKVGLGVWGKALVYRKLRYVQYHSAAFEKVVKQPAWQGILGPTLRAVAGDTIKVHFYNRTSKPLSMHPHGLHYDKQNEGADGKGKGAAVPPGEKFTYEWKADQGSAPGPADPSSIVWLYHSHVDSVTEIYDGLIGAIVITRKGMQRSDEDPTAKDVDAEFVNLYMIFDENGRAVVNRQNGKAAIPKKQTEEEEEGHLKHAINGYIYGNLPGLVVQKNQRVRWYLLAMGTEVDLHTAHWHGQTVLYQGRRTDVVELLPASMKTVDMKATNPGKWLMHCHVTDHITAGMSTRWEVK